MSPAELLAQIPDAVSNFWHVDFESYQAMLLAFAMLTHQRLGLQACGGAVDDVVRLKLEKVPYSLYLE